MTCFGRFSLGLVDLDPCLGRFMCPFDVAEASCKYQRTTDSVSPGHLLSWLLCMALMSVVVGGLKRHWCRYFTLAFAVGIM